MFLVVSTLQTVDDHALPQVEGIGQKHKAHYHVYGAYTVPGQKPVNWFADLASHQAVIPKSVYEQQQVHQPVVSCQQVALGLPQDEAVGQEGQEMVQVCYSVHVLRRVHRIDNRPEDEEGQEIGVGA